MRKLKVDISNSHVNNKSKLNDFSIINFIQDIEGIHINSLKLFNKYLEDNNLGVFLTYREINIIKRPNIFSKLNITTHPFETRQASGYRHIYIKDENNNNLITSTAFGVFVDLDNYSLKRLPKEVIKTIEDGKRDKDININPRKISYNKDLKETLLYNTKVKRSYIDRYNHMNNSYYAKIVYDLLDENFKYNNIRAEYIRSFKENDVINVYLKEKTLNKQIYLLKNEDNIVYSVVEFANI